MQCGGFFDGLFSVGCGENGREGVERQGASHPIGKKSPAGDPGEGAGRFSAAGMHCGGQETPATAGRETGGTSFSARRADQGFAMSSGKG